VFTDTCCPTIGPQARVEGEQERLDVASAWCSAAGPLPKSKTDACRKLKTVKDGAVVQEPEPPHLIAGRSEHADLLVEVPQVGDLELLGLALDARAAVGAERQVVTERALDERGVRSGC
jgi:hypothetical protein